jgi:glutathione S-transferase
MEYQHIKPYHYSSTCSARVKWLLHECVGDDFEIEMVSIYDGEQFRARAPEDGAIDNQFTG